MAGIQEEAGRRKNQRKRDKWGVGGLVGEGCCEWHWASQAGTGHRPGGGRMYGCYVSLGALIRGVDRALIGRNFCAFTPSAPNLLGANRALVNSFGIDQ